MCECGFSFLQRILYSSVLSFFPLTEIAVVRTSWRLEIVLFSTGLVSPPPPPVSWLCCDAEGPAGSKWHCWSKEADALRSLSLLSALPASSTNTELWKGCERWGGGRQTISAAVRRSDDSLPPCRYLMMYASRSRWQVLHTSNSRLYPCSFSKCAGVKHYRWLQSNRQTSHSSCPQTLGAAGLFVIMLYSIHRHHIGSAPDTKKNLKDKTRHYRCRSIIIKDPQFSRPLDIRPSFIGGRLLTSQRGIPFSDNIIPSPDRVSLVFMVLPRRVWHAAS